jgi:hypothetical protein
MLKVEPNLTLEVLTSQLEMVLQKKKHEKEHSEQIIKGVSLHDSIIDKEVITAVSNEPMPFSPNAPPGNPPVNNKVFNYVKGFDQQNEKRPMKN